jgi:uncharacterized damage-inducible protein DinB
LNAVLDAVGDRWETQVFSDGWTVHQLAIHLALGDRGLIHQVKGIAEGREVIPADFDLDRYNRRSVEKRADMTIAEVRQALDAQRADLLTWLDGIDDAALDVRGRHSSLKIMSVSEILTQMVNHERLHTGDIARVLAG